MIVSAGGTFTTSDLRAGRYTLVARARKDDEVEVASTAIDLVSNITDLVVGLLPAGTISGRVVTDDGTPLRSLIQVAAVLMDDGKEIDEYGAIAPTSTAKASSSSRACSASA